MAPAPTAPRALHAAFVFAIVSLALFALHAPLLRLPYFWDEAGYYIPAARDLYLTGSLIPHSTPSNAHPPLVMAYLAACWKVAGFSTLVTHSAMLLLAAFALLGLFRLAERIANREVAMASVICTALYPVFFMQSTLVQVDLAAAALIFWGLLAYFDRRWWMVTLWFSLAVLAKETALLVPLALFAWELVAPRLRSKRILEGFTPAGWKSATLLVPLPPLTLWYAYHYSRTGYIFGNPEFFRYNVQATTNPLRVLLALLMRLWQLIGYMNLGVLTVAALLAMLLPPLPGPNGERPRIALHIQFTLLAVAAVYVLAMSIVGGAVLARYMLPIVPLVIIVLVSTLWRRVRFWREAIAIVALGFVLALFINPPYGFTLEDNLAYRDYIQLHMNAERFLQARYPTARVLTAWPASGELTQPTLGYVARPMQVVSLENFTIDELMSAAELRESFDVALVFSTKYEPPHPWLEHWEAWQQIKARFFGYHRDAPPALAAQLLGGDIVYAERRPGQWIAIIELPHALDANLAHYCDAPPGCHPDRSAAIKAKQAEWRNLLFLRDSVSPW